MLVHMVLFRFDNDTDADEAVRRLRTLPDDVEVIRRLVAGRNVVPSDRAYDVGLIVEVDDTAALEAYQDHPTHQAVAAYLRERRTAVVSCDLEM